MGVSNVSLIIIIKMTTTHPTWIEIDRQAITDNCAQILRDTGTGLMAIVKADAYGHGAVEVSRAALKGGASWLGVARFGEGLYSHLAAADEQSPMNEIQCRRFDLAVHAMEECGLRPRRVHLANSAGAFFLPRSRYNLARIGNVVLGLQAPRRRQPKRWLPAASIQRTGIRDSFA